MTQLRQTARKGVRTIYIGLFVLLAGVGFFYWEIKTLSESGSRLEAEAPAAQPAVEPEADPVVEPQVEPEVVRGVQPEILPEILHPGLLPAFPGAQGAGAANRGGRGGQVIEVTNLNDSGPGSLRQAVSTPGPRIVVFRVSGVIELERSLLISEPYLTLAGQTAPEGGITLSGIHNSDGEMIVLQNVHNVVIRYLRIRNGQLGEPGQGQINIAIDSGTRNILIDHVSLSWSLDENLMIHRNIPEGEDHESWPGISRISIQRSLIAEGLHPHSTGVEIGGEGEVDGWRGVEDISIHHNLFVHNNLRNPGVGSLHTQMINNVVYNWGARVGETWRSIDVDWIANYFKPGPMSNLDKLLVHGAYPRGFPNNPWPAPSLFLAGNLAPPEFSDPGGDNWSMYEIHYAEAPLPEEFQRQEPLPFIAVPVEIQTAEEAYLSVLEDAGASARLSCDGTWAGSRDKVDQRLVSDVHQGTGPRRRPIENPREAGGLPAVPPGVPCPDRDHDGMPDEWEAANPPLDPDTYDASGYDLHPDYSNVEVFINAIPAGDLIQEALYGEN